MAEQQGAHGRRQRQGDDTGDHHRYGNGDSKLPIEFTTEPTQERNRCKHRHQHQGGRHHGSGYLADRGHGGIVGRHALFLDQPFCVLHDDDGVIHHHTDGQYQAKQGQQVDREPHGLHAGKRAHQGYRNRDQWNQRGIEMLQEQESHHNHQQNRNDESRDHLLNGDINEAGGVVGYIVFEAFRETVGNFLHGFVHRFRSIQRIGARLQIHTHRHRGSAVVDGGEIIVLGAQLYPCHIFQAQRRALIITAKNHFAKFFRAGEPARSGHAEGERLAFRRRLCPDPASGKLGILGPQRSGHIRRRQLELGQFVRAQPDTHGVILGAKQRGVPDAGQAHQLIQHVQQRVVGNLHHIHGVVR